jgi:hypothetical protein
VAAQARPIGLGETQGHTFCPAGDADWLAFYGRHGAIYRFTTANLTAGVSAYLYLFAPDGQTVLARNDDAPGAQAPNRVQFTAPADGWYLAQVKNRRDTGAPDARYTIRLDLESAPGAQTATPPSPAALPVGSAGGAPALVTGTGVLLQAQAGDAGSNGLPVFDAGTAEATGPDKLAPNATFEQARMLIAGAVYRHLNFVDNPAAVAFFAWYAKPFDCYAAQTGDLSPGLDTAILLWRAAPTRENRKLLAQNDDAQAHSADLSSRIRWCNRTAADALVVLEVRNYHGAPVGGAAGKSYSLAVLIDAPTPLPPTPQALSDRPAGGNRAADPDAHPAQALPPAGEPPAPVLHPTAPPTAAPLPPASPTPVATASPTRIVTPTVPPLPSVPATLTPTATPAPAPVMVDVVVYFASTARSGYNQALTGPDPGTGIPGLLVQVVDLATNHPIGTLDTATDTYGHARLTWPWQGPVELTVPQLLQTQLVQERDLGLDRTGQAATGSAGHLYMPIRIQPYTPPLVHP